jgi:16S rRNA (guanine527-N7)-methyltransferase
MEKFIHETQKLTGIHLTSRQVKAFSVFEQELIAWNEKFNLTAIRELESIRTKHFLDSLTVLSELNHPTPERLVDVGTGAGFPGIPLKIVLPVLKLTLVESVGKKAEFCRHLVKQLDLKDVEVINLRAEVMGQMPQHREQYDWAVARAVSSMPVLAEYLLPLVRVGGGMLAQKGGNAHAEVQNAEKAFRILGGSLRRIIPVTLPGVVEERYIVVVDKKATSPVQYPRRAGLPAKKPL